MSQIWRNKSISEPQFFSSLAKVLGQKMTCHWGEKKSLDLYLADFYALKREEDETLLIFN